MKEDNLFEMMDSLRGEMRMGGEYFFPAHLTEFMANLVSPYSPKTLLDPWAGTTLLANVVANKAGADHCDAVTVNSQLAEKARQYADQGISVINADGLTWLNENKSKYDAIVTNSPFGMRTNSKISSSGSGLRGDYAHLLLHESCKKLNPEGVAAFVMTLNFLVRADARKLRASIQTMGIGFKACISLPAKTFYPYTNIPAILVLFEEGYSGPLFIAQYSEDKKHQQTTLSNFHANKEGAVLSQGRFVDPANFTSYEALESTERLEQLFPRMGLSEIKFGSIVKEVNQTKSGKHFDRLEELSNSVYLPLMASTRATTSQSELPEELKSYVQLVIDPEKANATFVAGLLNTPLGHDVRDLSKSGTTIPRIRVNDLLEGPFYLAELLQQNKVAFVFSSIGQIRSELNELEHQLWSRPKAVKSVAKSLAKVNKEDRFEDWVETLPFPLASIIWRYHGNKVSSSARESCETLIHFFEALGEFIATIHLSAITSNEAVKKEMAPEIKDVLEKQGLSIDIATFGTWKCLLEFLTSKLRKGLNDNADLYFDLYRTRDRALLDMLLSKRLIGVLQKTNQIRNGFAHCGAVNESSAKSSLVELQNALDEVRNCFGRIWQDYELIDPGESKFKSGITHYKVRKIIGTRNAPFRTSEVSLTEQMEDGLLHLYSPGETRALPLLPFIKVMPSPKTEENACYFYNRRQGSEIRYKSYHFDSDPDVIAPFEDASHAIESITGTKRDT